MDRSERERRFRRQRRDQEGVFTVEQAHEAGHSREAIARRVASGEWVRERRGVLRAADHPASARTRIRAALLSIGEDATLVGRSAAFWWRMTDTAPAEVEVAVTRGRQPRPRPGIRVVRRTVPAEERVVVDGVAVTKKAATVLAAVALLSLTAGAALMDRMLQQGTVALDELWRVHRRSPGRYGAALAYRLLTLAGGGARSEAERVAHGALRGAGIGGWRADHAVWLPAYGRAVLDLAFVEQRVLVEIDGWAYHRDLRAFLRDAARQNALVLDGWVVIRTNWHELTAAPETFVRTVAGALAARRGA